MANLLLQARVNPGEVLIIRLHAESLAETLDAVPQVYYTSSIH